MRRQAAVAQFSAALADAGIASPMLEARLLACAALGVDHASLVLNPDLPLGEAAARLGDFASRRLAQEPVARILGRREFWGLDFAVTPAVLDPRPDSEAVIETILLALPDRAEPLRIADLGTGSGALLAALLHEYPNSFGIGVDRSPAACRVARDNLGALGFSGRAAIFCGDWGAALSAEFDLIVANPPYVASGDIAGLAVEVRGHDPILALDGGADGLDAYRSILDQAPRLIRSGGHLALELGAGQAEAVRSAAAERNLAAIALRKDLGGVERSLLLRQSLTNAFKNHPR